MRFLPLFAALLFVACSASGGENPARTDAATDAVDGARGLVQLFNNCSSTSPCGGDAICMSATSAGGRTANFCTVRCDGTAPCPLQARCGSLFGGTSVCLRPCGDADDPTCGFSNAFCGTVPGVDGFVCTVR